MENFKFLLINRSILSYPRVECRFKLETRHMWQQVGGILLQEQEEDTAWPIGYLLRILADLKIKLTRISKECLAVIWDILLFSPYLEKHRSTVITVHEALRWLLTIRKTTGSLACWRIFLLEFGFENIHRAAIKHQAAKTSSRFKMGGTDTRTLEYDIKVTEVYENEGDRTKKTDEDGFDDVGELEHEDYSWVPALLAVTENDKFSPYFGN